jgi:hypothetical protein
MFHGKHNNQAANGVNSVKLSSTELNEVKVISLKLRSIKLVSSKVLQISDLCRESRRISSSQNFLLCSRSSIAPEFVRIFRSNLLAIVTSTILTLNPVTIHTLCIFVLRYSPATLWLPLVCARGDEILESGGKVKH